MSSKEVKFFELTELLYDNDPAGTCCAENNSINEYDHEAYAILSDDNIKDVESIINIFDESFDGEFDVEVIKRIYPTIKRIYFS